MGVNLQQAGPGGVPQPPAPAPAPAPAPEPEPEKELTEEEKADLKLKEESVAEKVPHASILSQALI